MNIWSNAVITTAGLNLLAKLIKGNTLDITRAVAGAGFVTPGLLMAQKEVTDAKQELSFTSLAYPEDGKCALTCNLSNEELAVGYTAMQVGIFATDPDDGEILFFVAQAAEGTGTHVPANNEMGSYTAEWTFYFQYGNADNVTVIVDPSASVTQAMLDAAIDVVVKKLEGYVPATRKVNGKPLSSDIELTASDVGAAPNGSYLTKESDPTVPSWAKASTKPSYSASEVGAVPTTRKVNNKALSSDISLVASDVGAVPTTRKVNNKALSSDISLSASDVGAVATSDMKAITNDEIDELFDSVFNAG